MSGPPQRVTVSFEELAYSTALQVQALVELLDEKGLLTQHEVLEREWLQAETAPRRRSSVVFSWRSE
jgi:hypothetical protein